MSAPKVIIKNETKWSTKMIRPFVTRIAREEFPGTKPSNTRSAVTVRIIYNRSGKDGGSYCTGSAPLNSSRCKIRVPYPHPGKRFPVLDFCHVLGHEFGHCKGLQHRDMGLHYGGSCRRGTYTNPHYGPWACALPEPVVPVRRKPTTDEKRAAKLDAAHAAVVRWTRKRKLADTKLKAWTRKVRRLERTLTLAACSVPRQTDGKVEGTAP